MGYFLPASSSPDPNSENSLCAQFWVPQHGLQTLMAFAGCDSEEEDLEKMESDVKHMALKVSDYRKSLPVNLRNTFESVISDIDSGTDPIPFRCYFSLIRYIGTCLPLVSVEIHSESLFYSKTVRGLVPRFCYSRWVSELLLPRLLRLAF